ncbi:Unknown protein [Striga hermonthica]|uniref:Uncharacterized protein n=1 Tax=Striga hermonthica TaxID=68872 RepID=A0A9N7NGA5_STRHE|nr:Unknown protein [Striga hermonthica]
MAESKPNTNPSPSSGKYVKTLNLFERVKEEFEAVVHNVNQGHHKETHGLRDDIDGDSSIDEIKAPNVLERAKEEIEAIVSTIHPKKESRDFDTQLSGEARDFGTKDSLKLEEPELHSGDHICRTHQPLVLRRSAYTKLVLLFTSKVSRRTLTLSSFTPHATVPNYN